MTHFYSERRIVRTRLQHRCFSCYGTIPAGEPAVYVAGKHAGDFYADHYHPECHAAWVGWHRMLDNDEWPPLLDCVGAADLCDKQWLMGKHPDAVDRLGLTTSIVRQVMGGEDD